MRFTAVFLATLASTVAAQGGHSMAGMASMDISMATPAGAPAGAAAPGAPGAPAPAAATPPPAAAGGASKGEGGKGGKGEEKGTKTQVIDMPQHGQISQIGDGQPQASNNPPPKAPEGTSKVTSTHTTTIKKTATASKPAQQTKNAGNMLNVGSGLGLLGLAAVIIA